MLSLPFAVEQAPQLQRVAVLQCLRQQRIREVLVAHRAQEAQDRRRAHRGGTDIGGGRERPAMNHGIAHLDTGRPAIDQNAPGLAFKGRQQRTGAVDVGIVQLQRSRSTGPPDARPLACTCSSLAHATTSDAAPNTSACNAGSARKASASVTNNCAWHWLGPLPGLATGRHAPGIGVFCQATDTGLVSLEDARGEHGLRRPGERSAGSAINRCNAGPAGQSPARGWCRTGRHLGSARRRSLVPALAAGLQGRLEQEHRVDRTHFGVHRDRLRACLGRLAQRDTTAA